MKAFQTLREAAGRLSPRERFLVLVALVIGFAIVAIYGVMLPGYAAAQSAASRHARAEADLVEARTLAAIVGATTSLTEESLASLVASASARGLNVLDARIVEGAAVLRMASPNSINVLAWVAESSQAATLTSLAITADRTGGVAVDAAFGSAS